MVLCFVCQKGFVCLLLISVSDGNRCCLCGDGRRGDVYRPLYAPSFDKTVSLKSAAMWSIFWVMMAMAFAGFLYVHHGAEMASLFLTGYALEEVLSRR